MNTQLPIPFVFPEEQEAKSTISLDTRDLGPLNVKLCREIPWDSQFEMPIVSPDAVEKPTKLLTMHRIRDKKSARQQGICPHLFTVEQRNEAIWKRPYFYLQKYKEIGWMVSPDLSILVDMPIDMQMFNCQRNKIISAVYQMNGVQIIPAPSWGNVKYIARFLARWPRNSLIAINSTGIANDQRSVHCWLEGYHATLDILQPTHILRYGAFIQGENPDISTYFSNNNTRSNGSRWKRQ